MQSSCTTCRLKSAFFKYLINGFKSCIYLSYIPVTLSTLTLLKFRDRPQIENTSFFKLKTLKEPYFQNLFKIPQERNQSKVPECPLLTVRICTA